MFIEDLIVYAYNRSYDFKLPRDDVAFLASLSMRIDDGRALTTRQGFAALKVLRKINQPYQKLSATQNEIRELLHNPKWKRELVQSVEIKPEVRHLGDNLLGFRGTTRKMEQDMKSMKAAYSSGMRIVTVKTSQMLDAVIAVIGRYNLSMDETTEQWLSSTLDHRTAPSRVIVHEGQVVFDVPGDTMGDPMLAQFALHILGADFL